jgi:TolB-like protein/Tfp pilus assembly protein PilF
MSTLLRFDCFEVDLAAGRLFKHGARIHLRDQAFQVLAMLLERPGQVVTREELRHRLWPDDVFVDFDNILNSCIARLRHALHDPADHPRLIETLPKRGYRFIAAVCELPAVVADAPAKRTRLLVMPFVNTSGDPAQEVSSDAMTDDVITELAALAPDGLAVMARTTAMRYKGSHKDVVRICRELGVDYFVEGGVRRGDGRISINVQVIRAGDQAHVFAKRYDEDSTEVFGLQGRIAREIADHVGLAAGVGGFRVERTGRDRATRKPTDDEGAYNEYVQGLHYLDHLGTGPQGHETAKAHLEKALARDPGFALAHEALAQMYVTLGYIGSMPPGDAFAAGILHAVRALEIDNTRAETHALVAQFHKQRDYDWPDIKRQLVRALDLNPASPLARMWYAVGWLMPEGRLREAITELDRALEWDPLSYLLHYWRTIMLSLAREPDRVVDGARLMVELDPTAAYGWWLLGVGSSRKGLVDEAIAALQRAVDLSAGLAFMLGWFGLILGASGRADEARNVLDRLEVMSRTTYVPPGEYRVGLAGTRGRRPRLRMARSRRGRARSAHDAHQELRVLRSDPERSSFRGAAAENEARWVMARFPILPTGSHRRPRAMSGC